MLLQSKPLLYRTPSKSQRQIHWKADNLPHHVGPVRYKLTTAGFDGPPATIGAMRRARPYNHYRYDYLPLLVDGKHTQASANSYATSATRVFELPGGGAGITRPRRKREADRETFPNGMTGSMVDETALQNSHSDNNARIADAARARVRSAGKQKSNPYAQLFTYRSNDEYLQSRAKTFRQNQFHYDLAKELPIQQPSALGKFYRPQGAEHFRLRNMIDRDRRGPGAIVIRENTKLYFRTADDMETDSPRTIDLLPGNYSFDAFVKMVNQLLAPFTSAENVLSFQFDPTVHRISVSTKVQPDKISVAHFVITPDSQALWISFGFLPLSGETETERMVPAAAAIAAAGLNNSNAAVAVITATALAPPLLDNLCDPVLFHLDRNQDLADSQPLDASVNTFRKRYNNIQCAAPSYVSSFGLATATSLVYRKSFQDVYTKKHSFEKEPCHLQCKLAT